MVRMTSEAGTRAKRTVAAAAAAEAVVVVAEAGTSAAVVAGKCTSAEAQSFVVPADFEQREAAGHRIPEVPA